MLIGIVNFHKTGLPIDYSNVFDITDYTNTGELSNITEEGLNLKYYNYILALFDYYAVIDASKGLKIVNNEAILTVNDSWSNIRDYDYASIYDQETGLFRFFFITNISSNNDSALKPSCSVKLKWDAWANNLYDIMFPSKSDHNFIKNMHLNGYTWDAGMDCIITSIPTPEKPIEVQTKYKETPNIPYRILWLAVQCQTDKLYVNGSGVNYDNAQYYQQYYSTYPTTTNFTTLYYPVAFIDTATRKPVTFNNAFEIYGNIGDADWTEIHTVPVNGLFAGIDSIAVLSAWLTFNPPFNINYIKDGEINKFYIPGDCFCFHAFYKDEDDEWKEIVRNVYDVSMTLKLRGVAHTPYRDYTTSFNVINDTHHQGVHHDEAFKCELTTFKNYESRLLFYPYHYFSYTVNGESVPIIFNNINNKYKFDIIAGRQKARVSISKTNEKVKEIVLLTQGEYPNAKSAYDIYVNSQSNIKLAKAFSNRANAFVGAAELGLGLALASRGNVAGGIMAFRGTSNIANGLQGITEMNAKEQDLKNQIDSFNNYSVNALDDLTLQDDVILTESYMLDGTEDAKLSIDKLRLYGCEFNKEDNLSNNYRAIFDYKNTIGCALPSIKNRTDREEIQNAFDRGITKWHMDVYGITHSENKTILKSFNQDVTNIEIGGIL